ncbi:MAG: HEPN domain-containing protein [Spirochaetota bacterium]
MAEEWYEDNYIQNIIREVGSKIEILPLDIVCAVLFGSVAAGTYKSSSDIDLLLSATNINPKRHRRGEETARVKKYFAIKPLDVILLAPEEIESNFRNHNPLFLDIAEDCIIVYDKNNFFLNLVKETKSYIENSGIKRLKNGWHFPVKQGTVTYLSPVSNRDFAMAMLKDGERDYIIAKKLLDDGFYDKSVYHSQQSVEKNIKSVLISLGIFHKTHFVGQILYDTIDKIEIGENWKKSLSEAADISQSMEPDVSLSRYPGVKQEELWLPFEEYTCEDAKKALQNAEEVINTSTAFVRYWFQ